MPEGSALSRSSNGPCFTGGGGGGEAVQSNTTFGSSHSRSLTNVPTDWSSSPAGQNFSTW